MYEQNHNFENDLDNLIFGDNYEEVLKATNNETLPINDMITDVQIQLQEKFAEVDNMRVLAYQEAIKDGVVF